MSFVIRTLLTIAAACAAPLAQAHFFAVHLTHYVLDLQAEDHGAMPSEAAAYIGWGHVYPLEEALDPDKLGEYAVISADGTRTALEPNQGGFLFAEVSPPAPGPYIVHAAYVNHFYTWYEEDGQEKSFAGPKTGLENILYSGYFEFRAKALLQADEAPEDAFTAPIGDTFEVVPMENPYAEAHADGATLPLMVVMEGEPLPGVMVQARPAAHYPRSAFPHQVVTNAEGIAEVPLSEKGLWFVKAETTRDPRPEYADKCDIEEYMATLTFEVR